MITLDNGIEKRTLESFGFRELTEHGNSIFTEFSSKKIHVPGQVGEWDFGVEVHGKPFLIPVKGLFMEERLAQRALDSLMLFLFDSSRSPRELKVVFDYDKDKYIKAQVSNNFSPDRTSILKGFDIPFIANDPTRYSRFKQDEIVWGSREINFTFPYKLGHRGMENEVEIKAPKSLSLTIDGFDVKPIIKLVGSGTGITLTNKGQVISVGDMANDTIEINCKTYSSVKNGVETYIDFNDFNLFGGVNNVQVRGNNMNFKLSIIYQDEY